MLVSYNWLNKYFDGKLPEASKISETLTFHSWEIESVEEKDNDFILDIKVLPDKAMWALAHRGIAKDLSVALDLPMKTDPLLENATLPRTDGELSIVLESDICRRFAAARIRGVKVGPSPVWLKEALEGIGQRSINNIVDASNYVMFDLGQPSHAFDASLVGEQGFRVRQADAGERLVGLDEKEYVFDSSDTLITRADTNEVLSIAGIKGGKHSGISDKTTDIIVEVANWDPVAIRKTGQRLKLRTDASGRYENGIVPEMVPFGLKIVASLILEIAGGEVVAINEVIKKETEIKPITVALSRINSVLGTEVDLDTVAEIFSRFGWKQERTSDGFTITPPFERTDLVIPEDVIEEVGRMYGYDHVQAVTPSKLEVAEVNARFYYSELIRDILLDHGFSEIYTSSFREKDTVKLANALASDKGYLRSSLTDNMKDALVKNSPNADLLGVRRIRLFEIGTIFTSSAEKFSLALGVRSPSGYKAKVDDPILLAAQKAIGEVLEREIDIEGKDGVVEIDFGALLENLPPPRQHLSRPSVKEVVYQPYSNYPAIVRDIALWTAEGTNAQEIESILNEQAGPLRVRTTQFDEFHKEGKISYAFRLVFQSKEKTLTDSEVNAIMESIYQAISKRGLEIR